MSSGAYDRGVLCSHGPKQSVGADNEQINMSDSDNVRRGK